MSGITKDTLTEQGIFNADTLQFISKATPGATPSTGTKLYSLSGKLGWLNSDGFSRALSDANTASRVYTLPDVSDTIAVLNFAQTFTNKTITSTTNNITAKGLFSATTTVGVSSATAPSTGQVLTATSASAADWETPANSAIMNFNAISQTPFTTSSTSYVTITGMSITPAIPGTYLVIFDTSYGPSNNNNLFSVAIFLNGTVVTDSVRQYGDTAYVCIPMSTVVNWTTGAIEARLSTSGQSVTLNNRAMNVLRLA